MVWFGLANIHFFNCLSEKAYFSIEASIWMWLLHKENSCLYHTGLHYYHLAYITLVLLTTNNPRIMDFKTRLKLILFFMHDFSSNYKAVLPFYYIISKFIIYWSNQLAMTICKRVRFKSSVFIYPWFVASRLRNATVSRL